ncbi:DNA polymerase III subunit gamma/tau [Gayadomonas joobiniege]|uniref:DNA polymerase III subunit gamma/tau n=1 Tax=Gayadomonas joobiniege TaxID=1234606 RepID=UPI00037D5CBF|nr:DNA polymerase III subunit gamma/tau [Gayadomonas joobiniege]
MSYQALARKWRPQTFAQLMGQEHVVAALSNALKNQRLHHAYLFTGTRGVGKTTIARIFAKSLNCLNGVTEEPCGQCQNCVAIDEGRFVDLVEIDAASRTKVEDTREILDNVQYSPTQGRYKVYLIDEVHMLSKHSFNALLKTLEEPPEHVKFLLATTDPQKLPVTILSRCLQFTLKAMTGEQIVQQLQKVLSAEQIEYSQDALAKLAEAANGSMRDALSLTDQAVAQGNNKVTTEIVQDMLGLLDEQQVMRLFLAIAEQNISDALKIIEELSLQGVDPAQSLQALLTCFHQVALLQSVPEYQMLTGKILPALYEAAAQWPAELVQVYYQICLNGRRDLPFAVSPKAGLEMTVLRLLSFTPANLDGFSVTSISAAANEKKTLKTEPTGATPQVAEKVVTTEPTKLAQHPPAQPAIDKAVLDTNETNSESKKDSQIEPDPTDTLNLETPRAKQTDLNEVKTAKNSTSDNPAIETPVAKPEALEPADTELLDNDTDLAAAVSPNILVDESELDSLNAQLMQIESLADSMHPSSAVPETPPSQPDLNDDRESSMATGIEMHALMQGIRQKKQNLQGKNGSDKTSQAAVKPDTVLSFDSEPVPEPISEQSKSTSLAQTEMAEQGIEQINTAADEADFIEQDAEVDNSSYEENYRAYSESLSQLQNIQPQDDAAQGASTGDQVQDLQAETVIERPDIIEQYQLQQAVEEGIKFAREVDSWADLVDKTQLTGLQRQLMLHCQADITQDSCELTLSESQKHLNSDAFFAEVEQQVSQVLGRTIQVRLKGIQAQVSSPHEIQKQIDLTRLKYARNLIHNDQKVALLTETFAAEVIDESIKAL